MSPRRGTPTCPSGQSLVDNLDAPAAHNEHAVGDIATCDRLADGLAKTRSPSHLELTSVPANRGSASDRRILHRTSVTTVRNVVRARERVSKRNAQRTV
jgi:hypothetical protein